MLIGRAFAHASGSAGHSPSPDNPTATPAGGPYTIELPLAQPAEPWLADDAIGRVECTVLLGSPLLTGGEDIAP